MKKHHTPSTATTLAQALLGTAALLAGPTAPAQTTTLYGKVDLGLGKNIGANAVGLQEAVGSRIGLRGAEDLGGGWSAGFHLEHRFTPDTGAQTDPARFWQGQSTVSLRGPYGGLSLGYQYTAAYSLAQNVIDPWRGATVAQMRTAWRGGISRTRVENSIRYDLRSGGLAFAASVAEAPREGSSAGPSRPVSVAANYTTGPWLLAAGWENPANANDHLLNLGATYQTGPARLAFGWSRGSTARDDRFRAVLLGVTYAVGAGEIKAGFITADTRTPAGAMRSRVRKLGLGYVHHLSKRTYLYTNLARDSRAPRERVGYDLGLQHNF